MPQPKHNENHYQHLAENSVDILWTMDAKGIFTYVSPASENILGYKPEEFIGRSVEETPTASESKKHALRLFEQVMSGKLNVLRFESEHLHKDGHSVWCEINANRVHDDSGAVKYIYASTRDISEQRAMVDALKKSEERYLFLADNSVDVVYVYNSDGRIAYASPSVEKLLGFTPQSRIGQHYSETTMDPEVRPAVKSFFEKALRGELNEQLFDARLQRKDGSWVWTEINSRVVRNTDGSTKSIIVAVRDISDWRAAQAAIRESEEKYRQLAERSQDPILQYTADGHVSYASPAAEKLWGTPVEQLMGRHYHYALDRKSRPSADAAVEKFRRGSNEPVQIEVMHHLGNDRKLWTDLRLWPIREEDGSLCGFQFMARDVTERKRITELLERQRIRLAQRAKQLRDVNQQLEDFASTVSHDLRAPLRRIRRCLDTLDSAGDQQPRNIARIQREAENMQQLIDRVLEFSRDHDQPLRREPVDLAEMFKTAVSDIAEARASECRVEISAHDSFKTRADHQLVSMLLNNIVENAFKYANVEDLKLTLAVDSNDEQPVYQILDNGQGFQQTDTRNLFTRFGRGAQPPSGVSHGIGLTTAHRIVERHGGRIWAGDSATGGASVWFTLGNSGAS